MSGLPSEPDDPGPENPRPDEPDARARARNRRGLIYGFVFGLVLFGGVFLYLRVGLPALLFVLACFAGMLLFSK